MFTTHNKQKTQGASTSKKRQRRSVDEKLAMVRESLEPGMTVSMVARRHGVNPTQLFHWRKKYQDGTLFAAAAGEKVVSISKLNDALKQIKDLQWQIAGKTIENEILREALHVMKSRKAAARLPSLPEGGR